MTDDTLPAPARKRLVAALITLLACGSLLGLTTTMAKVAGDAGIAALAFLAWSILGACVLLWCVAAMRRDTPSFTARTVEYFAVSAFVGVAASNLIFFLAIPKLGAGFVSLMLSLPPLLTYVGAIMLRLDRLDAWRLLGVLAALLGAGALALGKIQSGTTPIGWVAFVLLGPVLLAIGNIYRSVRWPKDESAQDLAPGMLTAAALMLFAAAFLPGMEIGFNFGDGRAWGLVAVQSLLFAGQFVLLFMLQKSGGPVMLSLLGSVGAVVAVPVAVFLLGEGMPENLWLGVVLIGLGVLLVSRQGGETKETVGKTA